MILVTLLLIAVSALPTPDHCYDFTSDTVNDSSGNNASPYCDHSGCQFAESAYFYAYLPTGLGKTHTIAIWTRQVFTDKSIPFALVDSVATQDHEFRVQVKTTDLKMMDGHVDYDMTMPTDWAKDQWVMVYIFSDEAANKYGFGTYAPGVGAQYFEYSKTGTYNMDIYASSSYQMRMGTKNKDTEPVSNLRKILIYKGTAVHSTSANSVEDLLKSVDCPRLLVTVNPACQEMYFYYKMSSDQVTNTGQTVVDSSDNSKDATNGSAASSDGSDCTSVQEAIEFTGSCYLKMSGIQLSSRGFSMEMQVKVVASASQMTLVQEVNENKFFIKINPSGSTLTIVIDGQSRGASTCSGLQGTYSANLLGGNWVTIAVTFIANDSQTFYQLFCDQATLAKSSVAKSLNFSLSNFRIGEGFTGQMREFKSYYLAMGQQSFSKSTVSKFVVLSSVGIPTCSSGYYFNSDSQQCEACPALCTACSSGAAGSCSACVTNASESAGVCSCNADAYLSGSSCLSCNALCDGCTGAGNTACSACATGKYLVVGTNTCVTACADHAANYYLDSSTCKQCDPLCGSCTGAGNTLCTSCASGKYSVEAVSGKCVSSCTDHAANFFLDGTICKQCNAECATCSGSEAYNCDSCVNKEIIDSASKDPKHCTSSCGAGLYADGSNCRACATNCETCTTGAVADCSLCLVGYYRNPSTNACQASCPNNYYPDAATRTCPQCDPACETCNGSLSSNCLTCSAQYYSSAANTCSACDNLCDGCTGAGNTLCSACAATKYLIFNTNTCVSACSDHAANFYLDGSTCKECNAACESCGGGQPYHCTVCTTGYKEVVDSPLKDPEHCVASCGVGTYADGSACRVCAAHCETCTSGDVEDCSLCFSGYYLNPTTNACQASCPNGYYKDDPSRTCPQCNGACLTCTASGTLNCPTCASQHFAPSANQCAECDPLCDECTDSGNTACQACAPTKYPVDGTSLTCVTACSDHAPNFFLDGSVCKQCDAACASCTAAQPYNCNACSTNYKEVVGSSVANPNECVNPCIAGTYTDGNFCRACASNCQICTSAAASDCSQCFPGFFLQPASSECETTCPAGYYANSSTRECEPCSDSNCQDCSSDKNICTSCSTHTRYYLDGSSCSYCAAPSVTAATSCISCTQAGYSITQEGECVEICGDGLRVTSYHQCDDGNSLNGDGCSDTCIIEGGYTCSGGSSSTPDKCHALSTLSIQSSSLNPSNYQLLITLSHPVNFTEFTLDRFSFAFSGVTEADFSFSFESPYSSQSFFSLSLSPQTSIPPDTTLFFQIQSQLSFHSSDPYLKIPPTLTDEVDLPPFDYLSPAFAQSVEALGDSMASTSVSLVVIVSTSQCFLQSSMESLWTLVNIYQLIAMMPLMSIHFPANTLLFFQACAFINGDVLILQEAYDRSVGALLQFPEESAPYNSRFQILGYESVRLLENSGVFITLWLLLALLVVAAVLLKKCIRLECCKRISNRIIKSVVWSPVIRTFIETFLELGFCSVINIMNLSFASAPDAISSVLSLIVLLSLLLLPSIILHILASPQETLLNERFISKYGEVYNHTQRTKNYTRGLFYPLLLLHRYTFIFLVFVLFASGFLQVVLMNIATAAFLYYLLKLKPFKGVLDHFLNIVSTLFLLVLYLFCLCFVALDGTRHSSVRDILGFTFIGIAVLLFLINVVAIIVFTIMNCVKKCKKKKGRKVYVERLKVLETQQKNGLEDTQTWMASPAQKNWGVVHSSKHTMPVISAVRNSSSSRQFYFPEMGERQSKSMHDSGLVLKSSAVEEF